MATVGYTEIAIQGWLSKKGVKGLVKRWKRRWCWYDPHDKTVCYSELPDRARILGRIALRGCSVLASMGEGGWGFEISTPGRIYELQSDTETERRQWIAFVEAISQGREPPSVAGQTIVAPRMEGSSASSSGGRTPADVAAMTDLVREKEEVIRLQQEQIKSLNWALDSLRSNSGFTDKHQLLEAHDKIMQLTEQLKALQALPSPQVARERETEMIVQMKRTAKENDELKAAYFKAAAIGIMYQQGIPPDRLPPMHELFAEASKCQHNWNDWTSWLKTNLPKKTGLA